MNMNLSTQRRSFLLASIATLATSAATASAAPIINVGNVVLQPNTAGQTVQIFAGGGDSVDGVNLFVATGDGGDAVGGTANSAPAITGLLLNGPGMLFAGRPQATPDQTPQFFSGSANTSSPVTVANGTLLAQLTIDTTGYTSGTYALSLAFSQASGLPSTSFTLSGAETAANVTNGTITIGQVPEPATLGALAGLSAIALRRRRRTLG